MLVSFIVQSKQISRALVILLSLLSFPLGLPQEKLLAFLFLPWFRDGSDFLYDFNDLIG